MTASRDIRYIILDLDQVVYRYWPGVVENFSHYTGAAASAMLEAKGINFPLETAVGHALESYRTKGRTTAFGPALGLDEIELYRDHHARMFREFLEPAWGAEQPADPAVPGLMSVLRGRGVRFGVLTHGSTQWGEDVLKLAGIRHHVEIVRGIDEYGLRSKAVDPDLYADFMKDWGLDPARHGPQTMMVDDTPANLRFPKQVFGMATTFVQTDRVNLKGHEDWIDVQTPSLGYLLSSMARQPHASLRLHRNP